MGKNLLISVLSMAILFLFNLSCEEKTTKGGERTDWEAIKGIISDNPDLFLVDVFDTDKDTSVNPVFFREITSRDFDLDSARRYDADSLHSFARIYAAWGDSMRGGVHYFMDGSEYTKPIYAHSVMGAYFEKWGYDSDLHRGWLLKKISGNVITSVDTNSRELHSLHITSSSVDTVLYRHDILNLVRFSRWLPDKDSTLRFGMEEKITFTLKPDDTADYLFLHVGEDGNFKKFPFSSNGDGTFSASWTTTNDPNIAEGYKHAFVDVISHKTLTDTIAKYDSKAWGIVYRIK
jgi:hypothetical protein